MPSDVICNITDYNHTQSDAVTLQFPDHVTLQITLPITIIHKSPLQITLHITTSHKSPLQITLPITITRNFPLQITLPITLLHRNNAQSTTSMPRFFALCLATRSLFLSLFLSMVMSSLSMPLTYSVNQARSAGSSMESIICAVS